MEDIGGGRGFDPGWRGGDVLEGKTWRRGSVLEVGGLGGVDLE